MTPSQRFPWVLAAMAWAVATPGIAQNFEGLAFDPPFQARPAIHSLTGDIPTFECVDLLPSFDDVVDAPLAIPSPASSHDSFGGSFAEDDSFADGPGGDVAFLYADSGGSGTDGNVGESDATQAMELFHDDGLFSKPLAPSSLNLMMDDLDGERSRHLSLIGTSGFGSPITVVPELSAALLACGGLIPLLRRQR